MFSVSDMPPVYIAALAAGVLVVIAIVVLVVCVVKTRYVFHTYSTEHFQNLPSAMLRLFLLFNPNARLTCSVICCPDVTFVVDWA